MSTHATLSIRDGEAITGCYVHFDGDTMASRIVDFLSDQTVDDLRALIYKAQKVGGIRSFYCPGFEDPDPTTELLDDSSPRVIDKSNWHEDHCGTYLRYVVEPDGKIFVADGPTHWEEPAEMAIETWVAATHNDRLGADR